MRAIVVERPGGAEALEQRELPDPVPGPGEVLVDIAFAGVNYRDVYEREGVAGYGGRLPLLAGVEGSGTVAELGPDVIELALGDRVVWWGVQGGYAERVAVPVKAAIPVPDGIALDVACAALLQGMTAHYLTTDVHEVRDGEDILVHAAAGGVGLLLTQMVKRRGGRVLATTSSAEKAQLARDAGADEVLRYEEVPERVLELTGGKGVAAAYDGVGRATFDGSLAALATRGMLALYGAASGQPEPLDLMRLGGLKSAFLTRPVLAAYTATRAELLRRAGDVLRWVGAGELDVRIGARYPLAQARRAHEDLQARRTTGKLLLEIRDEG